MCFVRDFLKREMQRDRIVLVVQDPSTEAYRACQRRKILVTPDRRGFVQSMHGDPHRRVQGNAVKSDKMYCYSFPPDSFSATAYGGPSGAHFYQPATNLILPSPQNHNNRSTPPSQPLPAPVEPSWRNNAPLPSAVTTPMTIDRRGYGAPPPPPDDALRAKIRREVFSEPAQQPVRVNRYEEYH